MKAPKDMNFLIVDDMDNMRRSIRAMLRLIHFGKDFHEAANGRDAWKLMEKGDTTIDFIISDYKMPHMSGTEFLYRLRGSRKHRDIPFLMITAEANQEVVAEAAEHDVDAYMTKPFVTASLEQKIMELLDQAVNPSPLTLHMKNARDLEEGGDVDGAMDETKKAAAANPNSSRPLRELGRLFVKKGDFKNALVCFQKAIELNRLDVTSYHYLGQIYYRAGDVSRACEHFATAMDISPRHSDRAINFSKLLLKQNKLKEAEKVLKLVLKNNSDDIDLKEDVADACGENGLYEMAEKTYREILRDDPERFYLKKNLGLTLRRAGDNLEAVKLLEESLEKMGDDIDIMMELAHTYLELKMPMRADKWANKVVRIDPQNKDAKDILLKLA
ncbi:MAG: tetratricopeptide repeat protein [Desulfobulbaceae bacterium]|nr:tetratricopeptide repeat protein [Desulfobulbaceae bacterium]